MPTKSISNLQLNNHLKNLYTSAMREGYLRLILAVSSVPFVVSRICEQTQRFDVPCRMVVPGNAFDKDMLDYRRDTDEGTTAVFFGRLSPAKGTTDLLLVWKAMNDSVRKSKLKVVGTFASGSYRHRFFDLRQRLELRNMEFLGDIEHGSKLWEEVSKAKVLIYPSYHDAFPLVVLEALALGLAVVAYDTPAMRSIYGDLPAVFLVRRGDISSMADRVAWILKMRDDKFSQMHCEHLVRRFLKTHSSWDTVARAELNALTDALF
jgi:glycosyltransferase involved in cell wall biosynthesis